MRCSRLLLTISLLLSTSLMVFSSTPRVAFADTYPCEHCNGTGEVPVHVDCPYCTNGVIQDAAGIDQPCTFCHGLGVYVTLIQCPFCLGSGDVDIDEDAPTLETVVESIDSLTELVNTTTQAQASTENSYHNETIGRLDSIQQQIVYTDTHNQQAIGSSYDNVDAGNTLAGITGFISYIISQYPSSFCLSTV